MTFLILVLFRRTFGRNPRSECKHLAPDTETSLSYCTAHREHFGCCDRSRPSDFCSWILLVWNYFWGCIIQGLDWLTGAWPHGIYLLLCRMADRSRCLFESSEVAGWAHLVCYKRRDLESRTPSCKKSCRTLSGHVVTWIHPLFQTSSRTHKSLDPAAATSYDDSYWCHQYARFASCFDWRQSWRGCSFHDQGADYSFYAHYQMCQWCCTYQVTGKLLPPSWESGSSWTLSTSGRRGLGVDCLRLFWRSLSCRRKVRLLGSSDS